MADLVKTFFETGAFEAMTAAETFLRTAGFSIGSNERGSPRGIMFGDYDISKWRNLNARERLALHGRATGNMREGPVEIRIFGTAPVEAKRAFHKTATLAAAE
jgi:hypothetical protein